jgi:hypothetical protein
MRSQRVTRAMADFYNQDLEFENPNHRYPRILPIATESSEYYTRIPTIRTTTAMSNSTFQSFSTSSSNTTINGQTTSKSEQNFTNPSGTRTQRTYQAPGEAPRVERFETDAAGRQLEDPSHAHAKRIQDVTEEEDAKAKEREYEERMQDEYAKREGGA